MEYIQSYYEFQNEGVGSFLRKAGLATVMGAAVLGTTLPMTSCKKDLIEIGIEKPNFDINVDFKSDTIHVTDSTGNKVPTHVTDLKVRYKGNAEPDSIGWELNNDFESFKGSIKFEMAKGWYNSTGWHLYANWIERIYKDDYSVPYYATYYTIKPFIVLNGNRYYGKLQTFYR